MVAAVLLWAQVGMAAGPLQLAAESEIRGTAILLADLVVQDQRKLLPDSLANLSLGPAPLPGQRRIINGGYISSRIRNAGFDQQVIEVAPSARISVIRASQIVTRREMAGWVRDWLERQQAEYPGKMEIGDIRVGQDLTLPVGSVRHVIIPPKNQDLAGKIPLAIHCYVDGRQMKQVWAVAKIVLRSEVVVARKPLRRHKVITIDDIDVVAMDLAQLPSGVITHPDEVVGRRTQRKIDPNTVLRADLVELPPLVKRKDVVVILAEAPGLSISTLGEVQENGRLGDRIRVTNLDSRKRIYARVVDATTVKVDF
jgi:flagella basal body P-ring formation protein FlgA